MKDHDVIAIWEDNIDLMREEFKEVFNDISNTPDNHGLYTFILSAYNEYRIISEIVYVQIFDKFVLFLTPNYHMLLNLDDELQVVNGDILPHSVLFTAAMFDNIPDVELIGPVVDAIGNWYDVYSLRYETPLELSIDYYERDIIDLNGISIDDEYLMDASLKFLEYRVELFALQIEKTLTNESSTLDIEENPLQNAYFDRDIHLKMMREQRTLGNTDV